MHISFDTNELSPQDLRVLAFMAGQTQLPVAAPEPEPEPEPEPVKPEPVKRTRKPKAEPEPEPEPETSLNTSEDVPADLGEPAPAQPITPADVDDTPEGPTMADAVAAATKLVSSGQAAKVKEALAAVGAKRVSEVPADKIGEFLAALQ